MLDWIKYVSAMLAVLSLVKRLVEEFEVPGYGPEKKKAVLDAVGVLYDTADAVVDLPISKEKVLQVADNLIEILVKFYNVVGMFTHGQAKPA